MRRGWRQGSAVVVQVQVQAPSIGVNPHLRSRYHFFILSSLSKHPPMKLVAQNRVVTSLLLPLSMRINPSLHSPSCNQIVGDGVGNNSPVKLNSQQRRKVAKETNGQSSFAMAVDGAARAVYMITHLEQQPALSPGSLTSILPSGAREPKAPEPEG